MSSVKCHDCSAFADPGHSRCHQCLLKHASIKRGQKRSVDATNVEQTTTHKKVNTTVMEQQEFGHEKINTTQEKRVERDFKNQTEVETVNTRQELEFVYQKFYYIQSIEHEVEESFERKCRDHMVAYQNPLVHRLRDLDRVSNDMIETAGMKLHSKFRSAYRESEQGTEEQEYAIGYDVAILTDHNMIDHKIITIQLESMSMQDINKLEEYKAQPKVPLSEAAEYLENWQPKELPPNFEVFVRCQVNHLPTDDNRMAVFPALFYNMYLSMNGKYRWGNSDTNEDPHVKQLMLAQHDTFNRQLTEFLQQEKKVRTYSAHWDTLYPADYLKFKEPIHLAMQVYAIGERYHWKAPPKNEQLNVVLGRLYPHLQKKMMRDYLRGSRMGEEDKHLKLSVYVDSCYEAWAKPSHGKKSKLDDREKQARKELKAYRLMGGGPGIIAPCEKSKSNWSKSMDTLELMRNATRKITGPESEEKMRQLDAMEAELKSEHRKKFLD